MVNYYICTNSSLLWLLFICNCTNFKYLFYAELKPFPVSGPNYFRHFRSSGVFKCGINIFSQKRFKRLK